MSKTFPAILCPISQRATASECRSTRIAQETEARVKMGLLSSLPSLSSLHSQQRQQQDSSKQVHSSTAVHRLRSEEDCHLLPAVTADERMPLTPWKHADRYAAAALPPVPDRNDTDSLTERYWIASDSAEGFPQSPEGNARRPSRVSRFKSLFRRSKDRNQQHSNSVPTAQCPLSFNDCSPDQIPERAGDDRAGFKLDSLHHGGERSQHGGSQKASDCDQTVLSESSDKTCVRHHPLPSDPDPISTIMGVGCPEQPADEHESFTIGSDPFSSQGLTCAATRSTRPSSSNAEAANYREMSLSGEEGPGGMLEPSRVRARLPSWETSGSGQMSILTASRCSTLSELFDRDSAILRFRIVAERLGLPPVDGRDSWTSPCEFYISLLVAVSSNVCRQYSSRCLQSKQRHTVIEIGFDIKSRQCGQISV